MTMSSNARTGKRMVSLRESSFTFNAKTGYFVRIRGASRKDIDTTQAVTTNSPGIRPTALKSRSAWQATPRERTAEPTGSEPIRPSIWNPLADPPQTRYAEARGTADAKPPPPKPNATVAPGPPKVLAIDVDTQRGTNTDGSDSASVTSKELDSPKKWRRSSLDGDSSEHPPSPERNRPKSNRRKSIRPKSLGMQHVTIMKPCVPRIIKVPTATPSRGQTAKQRSVSTSPPVTRLRYTHARPLLPSYAAAQSDPVGIEELRPEVKTMVIETKQSQKLSTMSSCESAVTPGRERKKMLDDESIAIWLVTECNAPKLESSDSERSLSLALWNQRPVGAYRLSSMHSKLRSARAMTTAATSCGLASSYRGGSSNSETSAKVAGNTNIQSYR